MRVVGIEWGRGNCCYRIVDVITIVEQVSEELILAI